MAQNTNQVPNFFATGNADAAHRIAVEARALEEQGEFLKAAEMHKEVSKQYKLAILDGLDPEVK